MASATEFTIDRLSHRELDLRRAQLSERAERLRQEWRRGPSTSPRALALGKEVKALEERVESYRLILLTFRPEPSTTP
jgi:hypothetical protein